MLFVTENNTTRIALPVKHLGTAGDWGSDIGTASVYVNGERVFPKQTNLHDATLVGAYHEEFWAVGGAHPMLEMDKLPRLYCSSRPGIPPAQATLMRGWGCATKGKPSSQYYIGETALNMCSPIDYFVNEYSMIDFQRRYVYVNNDYAFWDRRWFQNTEPHNFYYNRMPDVTFFSLDKCAINYLFFNRTDQYQYFLVRPYALLLFKDFQDANIDAYFNNSGYNDGTSTHKFGFNFLTCDTWETPLDWDDLYIGAYVFDSTKNFLNNFGYHAQHHIIDKYTYGGHTYHIVSAGVSLKTVPACVASQAHTEACSPFGCISTPMFNVGYSGNAIDWGGSPLVVYGYPINVYVLEYGAEYYVGNWQ